MLSHSTISGNQIKILNGSVSGTSNNSRATGGGLSLLGAGDAVSTFREAGIVNSTITGNVVSSNTNCTQPGFCRIAGGGIWFKGAFLQIQWSTIAENEAFSSLDNVAGAGIHVEEENVTLLSLRSTIVANNTDNVTPSDPPNNTLNIFAMDQDAVNSEDYNLFDDKPKDDLKDHDQFYTAVCFTPLNFYGGLTKNLRPFPCSGTTEVPAYDNGGPEITEIDTDQRDKPRPDEDTEITDAGAVECQNPECDGPGSIPPPPRPGQSDPFGSTASPNASFSSKSVNGGETPSALATTQDTEPALARAFMLPRLEMDMDLLYTGFLELML